METRGGLLMQINNKRMMKSPLQLEALEMFYGEHKYPSEQMKLDFANDIGLSLKQVSGWFCHKRAKDKKTVKEHCVKYNVSDSGHDDYSSGVVQESCSSTNRRDLGKFYRAEVKSKMFHDRNSTNHASLPEEGCHSMHSKHRSTIDDATGESSSEFQDILLPVIEKHDTLRHTDKDVKYTSSTRFKDLNNRKGVLHEDYLSSTDLKRFYIYYVKRKLGRVYDENGPKLSVDFDPLPPGAFDSLIIDTLNASEACHMDDHKSRSHSIREVSQHAMTSVMEMGEELSSEDFGFVSERSEASPSPYSTVCSDFLNVEGNVKQRIMKMDLKIPNKQKTSDSSTQIKDVHPYGKKKRIQYQGMVNTKYQIKDYISANCKTLSA